MAAALVALLGSGAAADVVTEQSASILVFPKVIADGTQDTIIQITNTSNSMVHAHCFYVNAAPVLRDEPPGPGNPPQWQEIDFDISLTKQQPTHWVVSLGRLVDLSDPRCSVSDTDCNNAGFDPGRVPPQVEDFRGELKCVEVDSSGAPLAGNHLKGEATLVEVERCVPDPLDAGLLVCESTAGQVDPIRCNAAHDCPGTTGDVSKYNALGVLGLETLNDDSTLCLGGEPTTECPLGGEYNACPETWILNHYVDSITKTDEVDEASGGGAGMASNGTARDPVLQRGSRVDTSITVVPCTENFETQVPTTVTIQFLVFDEFESSFSASTSVTCWADLQLDQISNIFTPPPVGPLDRTFVQTRMRPANATQSGFMVVAEQTSDMGELTLCRGSAAVNVHNEGQRRGPDLITIPADQLQ
jgi:hypothetical protein